MLKHGTRLFESSFHRLFPVLCFPAVLLLALGSGIAVAQEKPASHPTKDAPGAECLQCHEDLVKAFPFRPHGKSAQFMTGTHASTCQTCHGDGAKHMESLEAKDIANPAKLPAAQGSDTCLACHSRDETHASWRGSPHDRREMSCLSCHSEHQMTSSDKHLLMRAGLKQTELKQTELKLTSDELCLSCHKEERKALMQRSTHLFRTEHRDVKLGCVSCHNPHGGEGRNMLLASSNTALCYTCHAEKRGPFLWEHAPARENCLTCHQPHGSNNPNLLRARTSVLCQQCHMHMLWRHHTVAGFDMFTFNRGCVNCHSQVHGTNHPSGKGFTR